MTKIKALLLTEGMHGMISQVEGMAKALKAEFSHKIIRLKFPWNILPPKFTPNSKIILKDKNYLFENENPDIIISCGRKSVVPAILLKKNNNKIFAIHIQNPKVNFNNFDLIVSPTHDNLQGKNIINSKGSIHYLTYSEIEESKHYLKKKFDTEKIVSLILGGPNKYYSFNNNDLVKIFNKVKSNFISQGYKIIIVPSRRTPEKIIKLAKNEFKNNAFVVENIDKKSYLSALSLASYIVVTCDSISMISEAATTGKPIFVAHMQSIKNNYRFKKFFQLFKDMKIIKDLGENTKSWSYEKFNEADRIAMIINSKLKDNK